MNTKPNNESNTKPNVELAESKALVTVFDGLQTATKVVEGLVESGFAKEKVELVRNHFSREAMEFVAPQARPTTKSKMVKRSTKWGVVGAGTGLVAGLVAGLVTSSLGLALGMTFVGGVIGLFMGGVVGVDYAANVDSVDNPTLDEYEQLVKNGDQLVVVLGTGAEVAQAKEHIRGMSHVRSHIRVVHGHKFHEHSLRNMPES